MRRFDKSPGRRGIIRRKMCGACSPRTLQHSKLVVDLSVPAGRPIGKRLHALPRLQRHVFRDHDVEQVSVPDRERGLNIESSRNQHCANRVRLLAERGRQDLSRVDVAV
jgi:hypothetical protein